MTKTRLASLILETEIAIVRCKRENLTTWCKSYLTRRESLRKIKPEAVGKAELVGTRVQER